MRDIQPFTDLERAIKVALAENAEENLDITPNHPEAHEDLLRWDATLRQAEIALAEMTRERDAYHWVVLELLDDKTPGEFAASVDWSALREGRILDAVLALPQATPQPSGNSGGFAAAAGILADTWDDESSEDAIRRIRDGTPREEATMKQVEAERDKLRDRVLDLEGEATDLLQELEDAEYEAESRLS